MNIYVCIKQVPDTETKIKINADKSGIDTAGIKWILSPYDEFAVEESLRLRDKNPGSSVTVISAGPARVVDTVRTALAMGADHGVHVEIPETADSHLAAKALAGALKKEPQVDIVFAGKEAIDDGAAQVGQLVAALMGIPAATVVMGIEYAAGSVKCRREVEGGAIENLTLPLPAMITAHKGLNEPRYASLPNIMKAKKKEVKSLSMADVGVSEGDRKLKLKNFELPPPKQAGRLIPGEPAQQAAELVRALHTEAKVV
ncbi:MAG: electron transfer flavoprotein subunit beta/FixA family protein [Bdellovibrionales bacterium]|nr:electron transfer flavoprotein subunit beta/FixA family protein [Bdellovibrionales bacterium]